MKVKLFIRKSSLVYLLIFISWLESCASTNKNGTLQKSPVNAQSSYSEASERENQNEGTQNERQYNPKLQKIAERNSASYLSRSFKDMFTLGAKAVYYDYDTTTVFVKNISGNLKNTTMDVVINPKTETSGIAGYYAPGAYYYFLMPESTRKFFFEAISSYLLDFDNKLLRRKANGTYKKYGRSEVEIEWGTVKSKTGYKAKGKAYFGYEFDKRSPYFVITLFSRANENVHESRNLEEEKTSSASLKYYFTRAQLKALSEAMSPEIISSIMAEYNAYLYNSPQLDSYDDAEGEYTEAK